MGIRVVMLTGDNQRTAEAIGRQAGVDEVIAGVLPEGKEAVIRQLQKYGKVAMVGDGINDAPALTRADTGIAIGAGTDVAIDAADVVLMNSKLSDVPAAIRLSRASLRNIHENLFWAFIYNLIGVPVAAGVLYPLTRFLLNSMLVGAAMALSSVSVVANSLQLSTKRLGTKAVHKINTEFITKKQTAMKKEYRIEGMMCNHCRMHVEKALNGIEGLRAVVTLDPPAATVEFTGREPELAELQRVLGEDYKITER